MKLQTLPGLFISHGSPMLALDPEQVGPALQRLSLNLPKPQAIVVMSAPSHSTVRVMQEATASPLMITVQQPQAPSEQDSLVPVKSKRLRNVEQSVSLVGI